MSFKAMAWAADQQPPTATAKLALIMMASMADGETNACWPSYSYLAEKCLVSRRTMATTIKTLAELDYIKITNRFNESGQTSNRYIVNLKRPETSLDEVSANLARGVVSANNDTVSANPALGGSVTVAHETVTLSKQSKKQSAIRSNDFDRWWSVYPNKTGKKPAFAIWKRINPPVDNLIQHTTDSASYDRRWLPNKDGETFIPNPTTYLNQERWNDEIQRAAPTETGFERTARMAHQFLTDQGSNGYGHGQALDMDGRSLPPPMD